MFIFQRKSSKFSRFASASFRIGMVVVLLLTACGPANPTAQPTVIPLSEEKSGISDSLLRKPQTYHAPEIVLPTRNSPEPDVAASQLPPRPESEPIQFTVTASPAFVDVNGEVTLSINIRNNSGAVLKGLTYTDSLENGLSFVSSPDGVNFDSGTASYMIGSIPNGKEVKFSYTLKVETLDSSHQGAEMWLHSAGLKDGQGNLSLTAQAVFSVGTELAPEQRALRLFRKRGAGIRWGRLLYICHHKPSLKMACWCCRNSFLEKKTRK
jgi:uncharacterized repeat protein (TIGR01451 family)